MTRRLFFTCAAVLLLAPSASAQQKATITGVPEIPFTSVPNFLKLPAGEYLGEAVAVATNSKGNIFVYHRRDTTRLFEFDKNGNFIKEIGKGYYGFEFAHSNSRTRSASTKTTTSGRWTKAPTWSPSSARTARC